MLSYATHWSTQIFINQMESQLHIMIKAKFRISKKIDTSFFSLSPPWKFCLFLSYFVNLIPLRYFVLLGLLWGLLWILVIWITPYKFSLIFFFNIKISSNILLYYMTEFRYYSPNLPSLTIPLSTSSPLDVIGNHLQLWTSLGSAQQCSLSNVLLTCYYAGWILPK